MRYGQAELYNVHELLPVEGQEALGFSRIPNELRLSLNEAAMRNALQTTGCEVRFNLLGEEARLVLQSSERPSIVEVYQGPFLVDWHVVGLEPTEIVVRHPERQALLEAVSAERPPAYDPTLTRVLLPWRPPALLHAIEGEMAPPQPEQVPATRMLCYGSSITHGSSAVRPSGMWASRTAQRLGVDLLNMGFGGGAHLEPQMADYIAGRDDWDLATLELGINIIGSIDVDEFARRVAYFVPTIAQAHPEQWIFCIDLFTCRHDWEMPDKIAAFRRIVAEQVAALGLPRLVHLSGRDLLPSLAGLTADLVHPSPYGMEEIAERLTGIIRAKIGSERH